MSTKVLAIYKKTEYMHTLSTAILRKKYDAIDLIEVSALDDSVGTDAVGDLIRALTDNSYDECYIMTTVTDGGGASGVMNYDSYAAIRDKMKTASQGTLIASGTTSAGDTSHATLEVGSSAVNDFYNGYIFVSGTGTGTANVDKTILDYVGATLVAEVGGSTWTSPDADTTYTIYDVSTYIKTMATTGGKTVALQVWETNYPNITTPLVVHYTGTYNFTEDYGTAQSAAAGTLVLKAAPKNTGARVSTANRLVNDYFNGMYAYIYSSTAGARQYRLISDYVGSTTVTCTLASNWDTTPTGTIVYRIVDQVADIYADIQCEFFLKTLMWDLTDATVLSYYDKLLDNNGKLSTLTSGAPAQDLDFLAEMRIKGDVAWQYSLL